MMLQQNQSTEGNVQRLYVYIYSKDYRQQSKQRNNNQCIIQTSREIQKKKWEMECELVKHEESRCKNNGDEENAMFAVWRTKIASVLYFAGDVFL